MRKLILIVIMGIVAGCSKNHSDIEEAPVIPSDTTVYYFEGKVGDDELKYVYHSRVSSPIGQVLIDESSGASVITVSIADKKCTAANGACFEFYLQLHGGITGTFKAADFGLQRTDQPEAQYQFANLDSQLHVTVTLTKMAGKPDVLKGSFAGTVIEWPKGMNFWPDDDFPFSYVPVSGTFTIPIKPR